MDALLPRDWGRKSHFSSKWSFLLFWKVSLNQTKGGAIVVYSPVVISTFNELTGVVDWRNECQRWFITHLSGWNFVSETTARTKSPLDLRELPYRESGHSSCNMKRNCNIIVGRDSSNPWEKTTTCSNCKSSSSNILLALGVWFFSWSGSGTFAISQILLLAHLPQKEAFVEKQKGRICFSFLSFFLSTSGVSGLNAPSFIVIFFLTQLANNWTF